MANEHALIVDLDGTLIRTDMLFESFWNVASREGLRALWSLSHLRNGRAAFKSHLARIADVDVSQLPLNHDVMNYIAGRRREGGAVVLCTASDQRMADRIASHLGGFDAVYGSDGTRNLKGEEKAAFLVETYGEVGFDYIGDSDADIAVWSRARRAITTGLTKEKRAKVDALGKETIHLGLRKFGIPDVLRAMRPHQWSKNLLVFLPIIAAHNITSQTAGLSLLAFVAFSLIASGVYVLNDLLDLSADRAHPRKSRRPVASGALPIGIASVLAPALLFLGMVVGLLTAAPAFVMILLVYFMLTTGYSLWLKRLLLLDVFTLAGLYTVRIIAGGLATGVPISEWLLTFAGFFFMALAAVKRQAELVDSASRAETRITGRAYTVADLPVMTAIAVASGFVSILVLALYVNSDAVRMLYEAPIALFAICPVLLFWITRMIVVAHRGGMDDDPIVFAFRDRTSQVCGLVVIGIVLASGTL